MLAIRMQRTGRKGHAQFRVIVQDSRFSPKSGRVVAYLGSYNPHTKATILDKDMAAKYLQNGARPSDTAAGLLKKEGVKLPSWVSVSAPQKRTTRHPEKLKRNRPAAPATAEDKPAEEPAPAEEPSQEPAAPETPAEEPATTESSVADQEPEPEETTAEPAATKEEPEPKNS